MSGTSIIKRRIKAVENTSQITKAMEMVSANKMRKSQEAALASRPYIYEVLFLSKLLSHKTTKTPDLMQKRKIINSLIIIITSDKGLAGSLNSNVLKKFEKFLSTISKAINYEFASVGKKAEEYLNRKKIKPVFAFKNYGDTIELSELNELNIFLLNSWEQKKYDEIIVVSTYLRSTVKQDVIIRTILPIEEMQLEKTILEIIPESGKWSNLQQNNDNQSLLDFEFQFEPDDNSVLNSLTNSIFKSILYSIILEANASEHSARMVAMKNASDNAKDLKNELSLIFNKTRQSAITQEISEISGGVEALNNN